MCVTWMHRRVVLWDWELMHFQAYVYIIFVYRFVYVDMSTRSSQMNHLSLESLSLSPVKYWALTEACSDFCLKGGQSVPLVLLKLSDR